MAARTPGTAALAALVAELRDLPGWPAVELSAPLVVRDVLRALRWSDRRISRLLQLPMDYLDRPIRYDLIDPADAPSPAVDASAHALEDPAPVG